MCFGVCVGIKFFLNPTGLHSRPPYVGRPRSSVGKVIAACQQHPGRGSALRLVPSSFRGIPREDGNIALAGIRAQLPAELPSTELLIQFLVRRRDPKFVDFRE